MPEYSPEITRRLDLINEAALYDEQDRALTYPSPGRGEERAEQYTDALQRMADTSNPTGAGMKVCSFDIDLTLEMPDDEHGSRGHIPISEIKRLQQRPDYIVGTCSDREPSDQWRSMSEQGFTPDFAIPKEMLDDLGQMFPDAELVHIGDDPRRDRDIAERAGWKHQWPREYLERARREHVSDAVDAYQREQEYMPNVPKLEYRSAQTSPMHQPRSGRGQLR